MSASEEQAGVKVSATFRLEKYDGDPPKPGEHKLPIEVIEGGDGLPTVHIYPQQEQKHGTHDSR